MTDTIDAAQPAPRPAAVRIFGRATYTYDADATAIIRGDEPPILLAAPAYPLGHGADAWITTGEIRTPDPAHAAVWTPLDDLLQDPPTGNPPPLPPPPPPAPKAAVELCGCCLLEETPLGRHGKRRRRWAPWQYAAVGALLAVAAGYAGLTLAAWVVMA